MTGPPAQVMTDDRLLALVSRLVELNDMSAHKELFDFLSVIVKTADGIERISERAPRNSAHGYLYEVGLKAAQKCYFTHVDAPVAYVRGAIRRAMSSIWRDIRREEVRLVSARDAGPSVNAFTASADFWIDDAEIIARLQMSIANARENQDFTRMSLFAIILRAYLLDENLTQAARGYGTSEKEWRRIERTLQRDRKNPNSELSRVVVDCVDEQQAARLLEVRE